MSRLGSIFIITLLLVSSRAYTQFFFWESIYTPEPGGIKAITVDSLGSYYISVPGYIPGDGGVFRSDDEGLTWEEKNDGFLYGNPNVTALCSLGSIIIAGDNGKIYRTENRGDNWDLVYIDQYAKNFFVIKAGFDSILIAGAEMSTGLMRSIDDGLSWENVLDLSYMGCIRVVSDICFAQNGTIYASITSQICSEPSTIVVSYDYGIHWQTLCDAQFPLSLAIDNYERLLLGEFGNGLFRYEPDLNQWEHILNNYTSPESIIVTPDNKIFLCLNKFPSYISGVLMSTNGGDSFEFINNNINEDASLLFLERDSIGRILVAGSELYRSWDTLFTEKEKLVEYEPDIKFYPNPCQEFLNVEIPDKNIDFSRVEIVIESVVGRKYSLDYSVRGKHVRFNTMHLIPGTYLLKIHWPNYSHTYKFIHY